MKKRIAFLGTPEISAQTLSAIVANGFDVVLVITQPDKASGRNLKLKTTPAKKTAQELNIPFFQPLKINSQASLDFIRNYQIDLFIVVAYGQILRQPLLDIPKLGCYNLHYSLLPKWRGAAPMQFCLLDGDRKTGVSLIKMDIKMDQGPLVDVIEYQISKHMNCGSLEAILCKLGADLIVKNIPNIEKVVTIPQNHDLATYSRLFTKKDTQVDWSRPASQIYRMWQAFSPKPGIYSFFDGKRVIFKKISSDESLSTNLSEDYFGKVLQAGNGFKVCCNEGCISVEELQWEGKKPQTASQFLSSINAEAKAKFFRGKFLSI